MKMLPDLETTGSDFEDLLAQGQQPAQQPAQHLATAPTAAASACTAPLRPLPDFATEVPTPPPVTFHTSTGSTRAVQAAVQAAADSAVVKSGKAQATGERGGLAELLCRVLCRLLSKVLCRGLAVESALQRCCTGLSAV